MSLKVFAIHKRESISFGNIQDKYAYSKDVSTIALSDGATQAFESGVWAEILVNSYIDNPSNKSSIFLNLLLKAANRFNRVVNIDSIKTDTKALEGLLSNLYKKGSYCTFVGVKIENDIAKIASYGDSVFFHFRNNILINSIPVNKSSDLDLHSHFLNTNIVNDQECFVEKHFKSEDIVLEKGDVLILSSDAFAKYLLNRNSLIDELINMSTFKEFFQFIENEWNKKILEEDDITIMLYKHEMSNEVFKIEPDDNFKFKEKIKPVIINPEPSKSNLLKYILIGFFLILLAFAIKEYMFPKDIKYGCMDETACNYDSLATKILECNYQEQYYDCKGVCINDKDGDKVCDELEIAGCTDATMFNYNSKATDKAPCKPIIYGCMNKAAINYYPLANTNNGNCIIKEKPKRNNVNLNKSEHQNKDSQEDQKENKDPEKKEDQKENQEHENKESHQQKEAVQKEVKEDDKDVEIKVPNLNF